MYNEPMSIPKPTTITVKREGFFLTPDGKDFLSTFLAFLSSLRMLEVVLWGDIWFLLGQGHLPLHVLVYATDRPLQSEGQHSTDRH